MARTNITFFGPATEIAINDFTDEDFQHLLHLQSWLATMPDKVIAESEVRKYLRSLGVGFWTRIRLLFLFSSGETLSFVSVHGVASIKLARYPFFDDRMIETLISKILERSRSPGSPNNTRRSSVTKLIELAFSLMGYLLPRSTRERVYSPAASEIILEIKDSLQYRSKLARLWLSLCFLLRICELWICCLWEWFCDRTSRLFRWSVFAAFLRWLLN